MSVLSGLEALLSDDTAQWAGSVEDLLYDGERVRERVELGDNEVVVTSHRLLALTPDADGENFRDVDLPNVERVAAGSEGHTDFLLQGLQVGGFAVVLLALGFVVDFESFVPTIPSTGGTAGRIGLGGVLGMVSTLLDVFRMLDELMVMFGALLVILAVVILSVYLWTRDRVVVVGVAGGPDISVPVRDESADAEAAADRLKRALFEHGAGGDGADGDSAGFNSGDPL